MDNNNHQVLKMLTLISQIGITVLTTIFMCLGIGYLIDRFFGTSLMALFIVLGVFASFKSAYILIRKYIGNDNGKA